jgi:threonine synthase
MTSYQGLIHRYRAHLPVSESTNIISLNEGNTPLIRLHNTVKHLAHPIDWYVKYEGLNPTGSFKDRGMTMAITKAVEEGARAVICASTGNTSAACAAYAARAGIKAFVIVPEGNIALGKLAQALMHGAVVMQIAGNFDQGLDIVKQIGESLPVTIVNSINPYRLQGQKTAAFEVVEQLGRVPDYHCLPVGNAGNISAYWMGYTEYFEQNQTTALPKMVGYQAEGAAPFLKGAPVDNPETVASAIRIGNPQSWDLAQTAQQDSGGWFKAISDKDILKAQYLLASSDGVFAEPASAASIAGVIQDVQANNIPEGAVVVSTLTGHGLKDPDCAIKQTGDKLHSIPADFDTIKSFMLEKMA